MFCVIEVDRERRRLILSERQASTETRESLKERVIDELKEGEIRTGRVTSLADFGVFVNINGADGLVHLSEISWDRIQPSQRSPQSRTGSQSQGHQHRPRKETYRPFHPPTAIGSLGSKSCQIPGWTTGGRYHHPPDQVRCICPS